MPNIIFIISMLIFTGLGINMVIRNIPYGIWAVLIMTAVNALAIILLIVTPGLKKKSWAIVCRIILIGWLVYGIYLSTHSANADATLLMAIYAIAGVLAIIFGIFRNKVK